MLELLSMIRGFAQAELPERPEVTHVDETMAHDGVMCDVKIGQEGDWLVIRPTNPLGSLLVKDSQFYQAGELENGCDELGIYIRWPIHGVMST